MGKKNMRGFAAGFAAGASIGRTLAKDWKDAQLQNDLSAASQSNQVSEQASGDDVKANIEQNFVPQEGGPQTAAEFIQQTPGVADVVEGQKAGYSVGGKSYDNRDSAQVAARGLNMKEMAKAYARNGRPEDAARLELQGLQLRQAERADRAGQEDEEYNASRKEVAKNYAWSKIQRENSEAMQKYEADMASYQKAIKENPGNPALAGMAPQKPAARTMTGLDMLHDANLMMANDMRYGRVDPAKALQYQQLVGQVKKEVGTEAFKLLHTGDVQGAIKAFESQGDIKIPEGAKVEARKAFYEVAGQKIPTHELVVRLPDGKVQVINGLQGMDALDSADKIIGNNFRGAELGLSKARLGISQAENARAQANFDAQGPARQVVQTLGTMQLALANEKEPEVRKTIQEGIKDLQSVQTGKNAPHVSKVIYGDDGGAIMVMSNGEQRPMKDDNGNTIKKGDKNLEVSLAKHMTMPGTGADSMGPALDQARNLLHGSATPTFASTADADKAAKAGKIKSGDRVIVGGKSGTWQ